MKSNNPNPGNVTLQGLLKTQLINSPTANGKWGQYETLPYHFYILLEVDVANNATRRRSLQIKSYFSFAVGVSQWFNDLRQPRSH